MPPIARRLHTRPAQVTWVGPVRVHRCCLVLCEPGLVDPELRAVRHRVPMTCSAPISRRVRVRCWFPIELSASDQLFRLPCPCLPCGPCGPPALLPCRPKKAGASLVQVSMTSDASSASISRCQSSRRGRLVRVWLHRPALCIGAWVSGHGHIVVSYHV